MFVIYFLISENLSQQLPLYLASSVCPQALQLEQVVLCKSGAYCRSVNFTADGHLLVACSENMLILDREKYLQRRYFYNCTSVIHTILQTSFDGEPSVLAIDAAKHRLDMFFENRRQVMVVNQAFSNGSTKRCAGF